MFGGFLKNFFPGSNTGKQASLNRFPYLGKYDETRPKEKRASLCWAPGTNMYFTQNGEVKVCCHNMEFVAGKYPEQRLKEIWKSASAQLMRADMKNYTLGKGCEICKMDLESGAFEEVRARHFDHIPIHPEYPTQMEFLLTNTCNLECVMCVGKFSSSIRKNVENLPPIPYVYDDAFLEELEEFIPYLKETRFSGSGEAFLIDANYQIWEKLVRLNPNCKIMVQTNGTVLNNRVKEILEKGNFHIGVSLDSLKKEVFEGIRPNAKFERVLEHIEFFAEYCRQGNRKFNISTCVMRQNWKEMPDFVKFSNGLGAVQTFHKVWNPRKFALNNLSSQDLDAIYSYLGQYDFETNTHLQALNRNHYHYFKNVVGDWKSEAIRREKELQHISDRGIENVVKEWWDEKKMEELEAGVNTEEGFDALKTVIYNRIHFYLVENQNDMEGNVEPRYHQIVSKIDSFLGYLPLKSLKEMALKEMVRVEIKFVVDAFGNHSTIELLKMAKDHLHF
ncbi:MAG: radical SAM protein [Bacteroidia bacterium]|nr:radical SAM protein [Bacteroidia bacterium]